MSYINFNKSKLVNLEYSLNKELLRSNRAGAYASTTIIGCNTRKYHGLLVTPQPAIDDGNHVLLSGLDETVIQRDTEFNLAIHKFAGEVYVPKGHKYIRSFESDPIPKTTYRVGGVVLTKERMFTQSNDRILIRYTLEEAHSPTILRFMPFLAFRNVHTLCKANHDADRKYLNIENGIKVKMYKGYSFLNMQFSKEVEYTHVPDWYYNFEYTKEMIRGYDCHEDLYTPGYFETSIKKGESIIFAAGTEPVNPSSLKRLFINEVKKRTPRDSFENCLENAAQQFFVKRGKKTEIIAGFPFFGRWGRDTFISLPGLTLTRGDKKTFNAVINTMVKELKGPLFPNLGTGDHLAYNSVDTSLWFFWTLQQYSKFTGEKESIWKEYGKKLKAILNGYLNGTMYNIGMHENGLIYAGQNGMALTWMDAIISGKPVTPRIGFTVEVNALWYNAIMYSLELAGLSGDDPFVNKWKEIADRIPGAFIQTFWDEEKGYLADFVEGENRDFAVRPNMIFAASLAYSPLDEIKQQKVLEVVKSELVTPRGIRTLSPKNPDYKGGYYGDQVARDYAYHNGTAFPWLLGHFAEAYLNIYGKSGLSYIQKLYNNFNEEMFEHGIGSISEVYDGDPPFSAAGAISQAWSVGELLRLKSLLDEWK